MDHRAGQGQVARGHTLSGQCAWERSCNHGKGFRLGKREQRSSLAQDNGENPHRR